MKIFSAQLKGTTTVVSGSSASITGSFTGSIAGIDINSTNTFTASTNSRLNSIETISASNISRIGSLESFSSSIFTTNTFTSSTSARLNSIETITASNLSRLTSIETITASNIARINSLETTSASVNTINTTQNTRLTNLENTTGSLATTGSNTFIGTQIFSGSLFVQNNLVVQGSSSLQNITASAVSIGTNTILLNTNNPSVRFAGISAIDSGSASGKSGSLYFDSTDNEWIFVHQGNTAVTSSVMITGPETYDTIGNETRLTTNIIPKSTNGFHIVDSCIIDNGTTTCIKNNLIGTGTACFTGAVCGLGFYASSLQSGITIDSTTNGDTIIASRGLSSSLHGIVRTVGQNGVACMQIISTRNSVDGNLPASVNAVWGLTNSDMVIATCNTERMRITATGNIGIGTTSPLAKLHVGDGTQSGINGAGNKIHIASATSGGRSALLTLANSTGAVTVEGQFESSAESADLRVIMGSTSNHDVVLRSNNVERIRIANTGTTTFACSICLAGGNIFMPGAIGGRGSMIEMPNSQTADILGMPNLSSTFYLSYSCNSLVFRNDSGGSILTMYCNRNVLVGGTLTSSGIQANGSINGGTLYTTTQRLTNTAGNYANMVHKVQGAAGSFSQVVICVTLGGPGGWGYIINSGGTGLGTFQSGGGYTNGIVNYSHGVAVGSGYTVTTPSDNVIRFVGNGGVHPFISIQMFGSLQQDFGDAHVCIYYS